MLPNVFLLLLLLIQSKVFFHHLLCFFILLIVGFNINIKGLPCPVTKCGTVVQGYVNELKIHVKEFHKLNTSAKNSVPFKCRICGSWHTVFKNLKHHIVQAHPRTPLNESTIPESNTLSDVQPVECPEEEISILSTSADFKQRLVNTASAIVTRFRCDVSLPEQKIQNFMKFSS